MRIEEDLKLDYSDVLFRPKRSTLSSRKDVDLKRTYKFKYSKNEWSGIPIMAANMDGVGELTVAESLSEFEMITCLTKQHDVNKLKKYKKLKSIYKNLALSIGIKKEDFERLDNVLKEFQSAFGEESAEAALRSFLNEQRKHWGKQMMQWSTLLLQTID